MNKSEQFPYHVHDPTTPWYEWLMYCEICHQLDAPRQPNWNRYTRYRQYLKEVGVI